MSTPCTAIGEAGKAANGGVTLLAINLDDAPASLSFGSCSAARRARTSSSRARTAPRRHGGKPGLLGTGVLLNGEPLAAADDGTVARLVPATLGGKSALSTPAHSVGFFVFPEAYHPDCPWSI